MERFSWSADIYVGMGLKKTLSTKGANEQGVLLEGDCEEGLVAPCSATFWSADIYVGMGLKKTLSTKAANRQEESHEEGLGAPFSAAATLFQ